MREIVDNQLRQRYTQDAPGYIGEEQIIHEHAKEGLNLSDSDEFESAYVDISKISRFSFESIPFDARSQSIAGPSIKDKQSEFFSIGDYDSDIDPGVEDLMMLDL